MNQMVLIAVIFSLAGCASKTNSHTVGSADTTQPIVLSCQNGLARCYSTANELCGSRGFDEIDRTPASGNLTMAGRLDKQGGGRDVYREDVRFEADNQTIVVRCK